MTRGRGDKDVMQAAKIKGLSSRHRLLVVSFVERGKHLRIISARPATAHERKRHES
jgi:uncharacterized DUF497 family protein